MAQKMLAGGTASVKRAGLRASRPDDSSDRIVALDTGRVEGLCLAEPDLCVYRGIPYAAAPVRELRGRPPQPAPRWEGARAAEEFGPACPQSPYLALLSGEELSPTSEDCLTLSVWTPVEPEEAAEVAGRLLALVWIQGGGFIGGWGPYLFPRDRDDADKAVQWLARFSARYPHARDA